MRVIAKAALTDFWSRPGHADSERPLKSWYYEAYHAKWKSPAEVKLRYPSASILKDGRVLFNIAGNKYRLVVRIVFEWEVVYIRFVGTHRQYDQIDPESI